MSNRRNHANGSHGGSERRPVLGFTSGQSELSARLRRDVHGTGTETPRDHFEVAALSNRLLENSHAACVPILELDRVVLSDLRLLFFLSLESRVLLSALSFGLQPLLPLRLLPEVHELTAAGLAGGVRVGHGCLASLVVFIR